MRYSSSEKLEVIRIVEDSELSVRQTLKEVGIHRSTFYNWYQRYLEDGVAEQEEVPLSEIANDLVKFISKGTLFLTCCSHEKQRSVDSEYMSIAADGSAERFWMKKIYCATMIATAATDLCV
jgi:transposase-like protein